jgi:nicotinic acid mononucleotide adenylyltransferase
MLELLIEKIDDKVSISKYELENDSYKGTYYTLIHFNHPYFVIGADSLENLGKWINGTKLVENSRIGELSRLEIGSQEGNGRSKATYEYIKVVKYPTATASLDE